MATIHEITKDWDIQALSPTWVKLQQAQAEFDRLREQVIDLEAEVRRLRVFYQADARRWRWWKQGHGLAFDVPTPTHEKPNRKITIIYSATPEPGYGKAMSDAVDAEMKGE